MTLTVQQIDLGGGANSTLNISSSTVIKAAPGVLATISLITAGSTATQFYDTTTVGSVANTNSVFLAPAAMVAGTVTTLNFPMLNGIVVVPGTSAVWAVSWT